MVLHYFSRKENKDKELAFSIYNSIIEVVKQTIELHSIVLKKDFNSSFELSSIYLFSLFYLSKKNKSKNLNNVMQELMNYFINDLDQSLREKGIGDMSIGKYVKSYVKRFYFRVSLLEKIFDKNSKDEFIQYINNLDIICSNKDSIQFSNIFFDKVTKILKNSKKQDFNGNIIKDLLI